jgi:hypothetical protein
VTSPPGFSAQTLSVLAASVALASAAGPTAAKAARTPAVRGAVMGVVPWTS